MTPSLRSGIKEGVQASSLSQFPATVTALGFVLTVASRSNKTSHNNMGGPEDITDPPPEEKSRKAKKPKSFLDLAQEAGLKASSLAVLEAEEYDTIQAVATISSAELEELKLSLGQKGLLRTWVAKLSGTSRRLAKPKPLPSECTQEDTTADSDLVASSITLQALRSQQQMTKKVLKQMKSLGLDSDDDTDEEEEEDQPDRARETMTLAEFSMRRQEKEKERKANFTYKKRRGPPSPDADDEIKINVGVFDTRRRRPMMGKTLPIRTRPAADADELAAAAAAKHSAFNGILYTSY